jgi:hypothetical protein
MTDRNGDGKVDEKDCKTTSKLCPDGSPMTDRNGDGKVDEKDCKTTSKLCPDGSPMTDRNGDGKVDDNDCKTTSKLCPDGSAMTDRNGDGKVDETDCTQKPNTPIEVLATQTCPNGSLMLDTNHDGVINPVDCIAPAQVLGETVTRTGSLPFTGSDAIGLLIAAALALGLGTVAMWISRRRSVAPEAPADDRQ